MDVFDIIEQFKGKRVLVVGDVMLDKYIYGNVERISPEAPVQIVQVEKENFVPGGAGNVASNITALGGKCLLIGIVGNDDARKILLCEIEKRKIASGLINDKRPTIQKVRVISSGQQLIRIDYEKAHYISYKEEKEILEKIKKNLPKTDIVVLSDYAKGLFTQSLVEKIKKICKKKIIADFKPRHKYFFKDVYLVTPNYKEAEEMSGLLDSDVNIIGGKIVDDLNSNVLITKGKDGMSLFEKERKRYSVDLPTVAKEVYDVSGAGDTVVAVLALSIASGADLKTAAVISNHAAGIVVGKVGTATLNVDELKKSFER